MVSLQPKFEMASTNLSIKEAILTSALSNAALLIAAPSLGCLRTYTKAFTDLCRLYDLNKPELSHILNYSPTASSSSRKSPKTECLQKATRVTPDSQEPKAQHIEIKKEPEDFECDTINVTPDEYLYKENPICQGSSLEEQIKNEVIKLEILLDITLEIPSKKECSSKVALTEVSTNTTIMKKHVENKDPRLKASYYIASQKSVNLANVSSMDQACIKNNKTLQTNAVTCQSKLKFPSLQVDNTSDYEPSANTDHYSAMLRDISKSLTISKSSEFRDNSSMLLSPKTSVYSTIESPKTSVCSIVNNTSIKQFKITRKKVRKLKNNQLYGTPFGRALDKTLNVSKESLKGHKRTKSQGTPHEITAIKEGKPTTVKVSKLFLKDQDKTKSKINSQKIPDSNKGQPEILSFQKGNTLSNSSMYSFLDNAGRKQCTQSSEEVRKILAKRGIPINFFSNSTIWGTDVKTCLVYVGTPIEVSILTSTLCIWLKDEGIPIMISFSDICEISHRNGTITVYYDSKISNCVKHIYLWPQGTKSRTTKKNIVATVNWLQNFLG